MSSSAVPNAPDLDKTIEAAQAELARAVQICSLRNDPLRHPLEALSATLGAMHRIFADGSRAVADQIANAPHAVSKAELDEACERIAATVAANSRETMKAGGRDIANWAVMRLDRSTTILFWSLVVGALIVGGLLDRFVIEPAASRPLVYICAMTGPNGTCQRGAWVNQ